MEEQRRREAEEAHNLRAAQDMSRLSLGSQASTNSAPPPPHYPPPAYSVVFERRLRKPAHRVGHGIHGC